MSYNRDEGLPGEVPTGEGLSRPTPVDFFDSSSGLLHVKDVRRKRILEGTEEGLCFDFIFF